MPLVVSEIEFKSFMNSHPFETNCLGTRYKYLGKEPVLLESRIMEDWVWIVFSDTCVYLRGKRLLLLEMMRNQEIGVYVDMEDSTKLAKITYQYDNLKYNPNWK
ncbi:MAG: hypothetical protein JEZ02_20225 [Desulfatibacillum sp.]|nr:hypothetical protein [Desulfatibacillum sp.]